MTAGGGPDVSTKHAPASAFQKAAVGQGEGGVGLELVSDQGLGVRHRWSAVVSRLARTCPIGEGILGRACLEADGSLDLDIL